MSLSRKFAFSFVVKVTLLLFGMATSIVVARLLGPTVLGTFSSALAIVSLFALVGDLGFGTAHSRILARTGEPESAMGTFLLLKIVSLIILAAMLIPYLIYGRFSESDEYFAILMVCAVVVLLEQFSRIGVATFNARVERRKAEFPGIVRNVGKNIVKLMVAAWGLGALALAYAELVGATLMLGATFWLLRDIRVGWPSAKLAGAYLRTAFPLMFIALSQGVVHNLDRVMIKYSYIGEIGNAEVGVYTAGMRLGSLLQVFITVTGVIFFPTFAKLARNAEYGRIGGIIRSYQLFLLYFLLPACVLLVVFAQPIILYLLGEEYQRSIGVLQYIVCGMVVFILFQPYVNLLSGGQGRLRLVSVIFLVYALSNILLNLLLIPEKFAGMNMAGLKSHGAAIGTAISYLVLGSMAWWFGRKHVPREGKSNMRFEAVWLGVLTASLYAGVSYFALESFAVAIMLSGAFMTVYICGNIVFSDVNARNVFSSLGKLHPSLNLGSASSRNSDRLTR